MEINDHVQISISDTSCVGSARRSLINLAESLHFSESDISKLAIIITETATNLIKHANPNGKLLLRTIQDEKNVAIEILAIDKGPGIDNISKCLDDGFTTKDSCGTGLGAISRLSSFNNIYSLPNSGTILQIQFYKSPFEIIATNSLTISGICIAKPGQSECGDNWACYQQGPRTLILVADGLGHGHDAAIASNLAKQIFLANVQQSPGDIIKIINPALRKTRGCAIAIADINIETQQVKYAGLGNIGSTILHPKKPKQHLVSHDGTAGIRYATARSGFNIRELNYIWDSQSHLIMHSDGLLTRWSLEKYPDVLSYHPAIAASILYRDFCRGTDDTTVVVAHI